MRWHVLLALAAGLLLAADKAADDAAKKESKSLQGTWRTTSFRHNGNTIPEENTKTWTLVIKDDRYVLTIGDNTEEGTFKIDPTKKPKTVDVMPETGGSKGKKRLGIYEVKDDEATLCVAAAGKEDRPTELVSDAGSENYLWTFKREKK